MQYARKRFVIMVWDASNGEIAASRGLCRATGWPMPTRQPLPSHGASASLPALGVRLARACPVEHVVANDPVAVDHRVVRSQGARVAPVPVQAEPLGHRGRPSYLEEFGDQTEDER